MINRSIWIIALFIFSGVSQSVARQTPEKPNIILIQVDDLGWTDLECYGSKYYETPNIDLLAQEGMRFTNAYSSGAICSPTRAAVLTGKAPARIGITDWIRARFQGGDIPENKIFQRGYQGDPSKKLLTPENPLWLELEEVTIAELLKQKGYTTAHIGKWHLGTEEWYPEKQGFDINIGGCDYGQPPSYFDPYQNDQLPGIPTLLPRKTGEYLEDRLADEAAAFIEDHRDHPFFLYMNNYGVHTPIQGKPELVKKYEQKAITNQNSPEYAAMVESVDQSVGKIMQVLRTLDLENNTLIIFTSDNGGLERALSTDNDPLRSGKGFPYEGGIRIPLIYRWPGKIEMGISNDTPVISHDIFPTLSEILGIDPEENIDGKSILPILVKGQKLKERELFWHFPHYRQGIEPYSIIRDGDWKLIKRYEGKEFELFNLKEDLSETKDLSEDFPQTVVRLNKNLMDWLQKVGAQMPVTNPDYLSASKEL